MLARGQIITTSLYSYQIMLKEKHVIKVNKEWGIEKAFYEINSAHNPGGTVSGPLRNAAIQQWITLIGRKKAFIFFNKELKKSESKVNFCRKYHLSNTTLKRMLAYINDLEENIKRKNRFEHVDKAYQFLVEKEKNGSHFTIHDS